MDAPKFIRELIYNAIDAKCTVIRIGINESFDVHVTDDGCGFSEIVLRDIGERQVFSSNILDDFDFRYGRNGMSLIAMTKMTEHIYIESIKQNSNVRFYKTINYQKSEHSFHKVEREWENATVLTDQGTTIVLTNLMSKGGDPNSIKREIITVVTAVSLINFKIKFSLEDAEQALYESDSKHTLYEKFEDFLYSQNFYSKIKFVSCEKDDVKVTLYLCSEASSTTSLQFVYCNKRKGSPKWENYVNGFCGVQFKNDATKFAAYLVDVRATNDTDKRGNNLILYNCLKRCMEQLLPSSEVCIENDKLEEEADEGDFNEILPS